MLFKTDVFVYIESQTWASQLEYNTPSQLGYPRTGCLYVYIVWLLVGVVENLNLMTMKNIKEIERVRENDGG